MRRLAQRAVASAGLGALIFAFAGVALGQPPDPANSSVSPWDSYGQAFVSPGTQSGVDSLWVHVHDSGGNPIPGATVEIVFDGCADLCIDEDSGLSAITDASGQVYLDPRVGGCAECQVSVIADGVTLASYSRVVSPDWDGNAADGKVDLIDFAYLQLNFGSSNACWDYNNDGIVDMIEFGIVQQAIDAGDANTFSCAGATVDFMGNTHYPLGTAGVASFGSDSLVVRGFEADSTCGVLLETGPYGSYRVNFSISGGSGTDAVILPIQNHDPGGGWGGCCYCYDNCGDMPSSSCTGSTCSWYAGRLCALPNHCSYAVSYNDLVGAADFLGYIGGAIEWFDYYGAAEYDVEVRLGGTFVAQWTTSQTQLQVDPAVPVGIGFQHTTNAMYWNQAITVFGPQQVTGDEVCVTPVAPSSVPPSRSGLALIAWNIDRLTITEELFNCDCDPSWAERAASGPAPRRSHAAVKDGARNELVIFGGVDQGGTRLDDTWVWDGATWTQKLPTTSPSPRNGARMIYDSARQLVVLHGGRDDVGFPGDTWEWDGNEWTLVASAGGPAVHTPGMAYDPVRQLTVLYGGSSATGRSGSTWEYDGAVWSLITNNSPPGYRSGQTLVWDATANWMHMFGGQQVGGVETNHNWAYDAGVWTDLGAGGPSARHYHAMTANSQCGGLYLYGGVKDGIYHQDLWLWEGGSWMEVASSNDPGPLQQLSLDFDPADSSLLLFGGSDGAVNQAPTWSFGCVTATGVAELGSAPATLRVGAAYPNPFRSSTTIDYTLPEAAPVMLAIYDVAGRLIRRTERQHQSRGAHRLVWDGRDQRGRLVSSGVYFYQLEMGQETRTKRILLLR